MNTNDLPPAAKLAALIEAGRVAFPNVRQSRCMFYMDHGDSAEACALGFAMLAAGGVQMANSIRENDAFLLALPAGLPGEVANMNDSGASISEICQSLREGVLAKLPA